MARANVHFIQVITTTDTQELARTIAKAAVRDRVAACAQVFGPISSTYWWEGKIEEATEWFCLLKTVSHNYPALEALIKANHSYTVPEILAVPVVAGNPDYLAWLRENTQPNHHQALGRR